MRRGKAVKQKKSQILVIDDNAVNRLALKHFLLQEGYEPILTASGAEGIEVAFKGQIDLILLDVMMPDMNGFEVLRRLQADSQAKHIPVIFVSALAEDKDILKGLRLGARDYVSKPINPELFKLRIRNVLELVQANQSLQRTINDLTKEINLRTEVEINLRASRQQLQQFALLDALTQIPNRRQLDESLKRNLADMHRKQEPLSFLMCDIDYFKNYNDTYGHKAGDECLTQVARALVQATNRPSDLVARFGGEEFTLLLPSTTLEGALHVARNIQKNLHRIGIAHLGTLVQGQQTLTISIGIYNLIPQDNSNISEIIERADLALYHAKNKGRNCVALCDPQGYCHVENFNY